MATFLAEALLSRNLHSSSSSNGSCPYEPSLHEYNAVPIFSDWTFYHFNVYLSGACTIFAALVMWLLQLLHAIHYSRPKEQAKIMRICNLIPAYSLISWFCIFYPVAYDYFYPWLDMVQSICMVSFFLLLCEFVAPDEDQRSAFFTTIDITSKRDKNAPSGRVFDTPEKKLQWYRRKWIAVFQYPIISAFVGIVTDVSEALGHYCDSSLLPQYAHLWMFLLSNLSVSIAVTAILMYYTALKVHLAHHRPLAKLGAIKLVVFLGFIQGILFQVLQATKVMKPTEMLTYADIKIGIPTLVTCIEMVPLALFSHYGYSYRLYVLGNQAVPNSESHAVERPLATHYQGGILGWRAYLQMLDPREALFGFFFAFKMAGEWKKHQAEQSDSGSMPLVPAKSISDGSYDQPGHGEYRIQAPDGHGKLQVH